MDSIYLDALCIAEEELNGSSLGLHGAISRAIDLPLALFTHGVEPTKDSGTPGGNSRALHGFLLLLHLADGDPSDDIL
jgi:hypothetical protein